MNEYDKIRQEIAKTKEALKDHGLEDVQRDINMQKAIKELSDKMDAIDKKVGGVVDAWNTAGSLQKLVITVGMLAAAVTGIILLITKIQSFFK